MATERPQVPEPPDPPTERLEFFATGQEGEQSPECPHKRKMPNGWYCDLASGSLRVLANDSRTLEAALRARPVEPPPITTETRTLPSGRQFIRHRCACGSRWDTPLPGESPFLDPESEWHKPGCVYGVEPPPPSEPTVADVLDWLKKRPGCSWQATIIDIEKVLAELRAGPPDRREPT